MKVLEQLRAGKLAGSRRLKLSCGLREFPREIFGLADTLEILDLSGNELTTLPADLPHLHQLRVLFCSDNPFTELPTVLGQCQQLSMVGFKANQIRSVPAAALPRSLRWLILTDNQIRELPAEIGQCQQLQKLMLAGNQLQTLPPQLAACSRLELLRVSVNQLSQLPECIFTLPRLAWLAFAGNPLTAEIEAERAAAASVPDIPWHQLQLGRQLGEGASGVISQALWQDVGQQRDVALKLFKGDVTSDGLPASEMLACIAAGAHPQLIPVLGRLVNHPAAVPGLVLTLIDPEFRVLAGPPSLESCTRDIYAEHTRFSLQSVLRMAHSVAAVARHLHHQGIMHGDLYGHNILYKADGELLLGDFGAASFLPSHLPSQALALQRMEIRAFACLLQELIAHCEFETNTLASRDSLLALQACCDNEIAAQRPLFSEVEQVLANLLSQL